MSTVDFDLVYLFQQMEWLGNQTYETLDFLDGFIDGYMDLIYLKWLLWLLMPILMAFLLPFVIFILLYLSALFLYGYRYWHNLREAYSHSLWDGARHSLALVWETYGAIWHGYEAVGLENIPTNGSALLVYYHGAIPIDYYYLLAKCILVKKRMIHAVGDRFLFKIPGWRLMMEVFMVSPGSVQSCAQALNEGHLLSIAPGGVLEAQFGDETYRLLWGRRVGFAKVALEAGTPVIPVFTQNVREAFRSLSLFRGFFSRLYNRTRFPCVPIYGNFPVKMRTHVGKPLYFNSSQTPEEVATITANALQELIRQNQRIPGSILHALLDRFRASPHRHPDPIPDSTKPHNNGSASEPETSNLSHRAPVIHSQDNR